VEQGAEEVTKGILLALMLSCFCSMVEIASAISPWVRLSGRGMTNRSTSVLSDTFYDYQPKPLHWREVSDEPRCERFELAPALRQASPTLPGRADACWQADLRASDGICTVDIFRRLVAKIISFLRISFLARLGAFELFNGIAWRTLNDVLSMLDTFT
jgi:hypothetical protein